MQATHPSRCAAPSQRRAVLGLGDRSGLLVPRTAERASCSPRTTHVWSPHAGCSSSRPVTVTAASHAELASLLSRRTAAATSSSSALERTAVAAAAPSADAVLPSPAAHSPFTTALPVASITRILVVVQPQNLIRNLAQRKWPNVSGPVSLLLFLLGMVLAAWAAVRAALIRRVKKCSGCRGYGIVRCNLCAGNGQVDWRAKFNYSDCCPLCMSKRFVECPDCGGHYHRPLFSHAKRSDGGFATQQ